ncbi:putative glycoside hydrolase [Pseudonocardia halophobica]|uniref:putative glycoside hydrolase n=1 Tax=Pseudonocardia halophobica TaxID=29401 RepID=UPI003D92517B
MRILRRRRTTALRAAALCAVLSFVAACISGSSGRNESVVSGGVPFPRSAVYWLTQDHLPAAEELARYDVVVIDSEWAHRVDKSFFQDLRHRHPGILLLAYANVVDYPPRLGSAGYYADRYRLWQYTSSTRSHFPKEWLAHTASGALITQWPGTVMANLADTAPEVDGETYAEYAANWVVDTVWSSGVWDGIFLDVWGDRIYGADRDSWDVDDDGIDDPASAIYGADSPWERGITSAETILRERMPGAVLVANGDRTLKRQLLDGRVFESFADPVADRGGPTNDLHAYVSDASSEAHHEPGVALNINVRRAPAGSPRSLADARFYLTATLLQDGYWAPMGADYGETAWYDELDGAGAGPGYLGLPKGRGPTWDELTASFDGGVGTVAPGVFRRDFEHGIVLTNTSDSTRTVDLDGTFRKLRGAQDPIVNDGSSVTSVVLPPHDGLILLRPEDA